MIAENIGQSSQWLSSGTLWQQIQDSTLHALDYGALQPVSFQYEWIELAGIGFWAQVASNLARRDAAKLDTPKSVSKSAVKQSFNPFLPYGTALFVTHLSDTHLCLLNKFNVVNHHALIVTQSFVDQETPLTLQDFEAVSLCLTEFDGLVFYNSGQLAGGSQPHRHLQIIPLPFADSQLPIESLIAQAQLSHDISTIPAFPFVHAIVPLSQNWADPLAAQSILESYHRLLNVVGFIQPDLLIHPFKLNSYNLLITRQWMLLIPRQQACFESISINALGFAGLVSVKEESQLQRLKECGLIEVLRAVSSILL